MTIWYTIWNKNLINQKNIITLDVGGTTAKCSLIENGNVKINTNYWIEKNRLSAGYPVMLPVVDIVEIGNGGGSIAWVDDYNKLHVGPQSAGADPGPVSYGKGGTSITTTDANLIANRINQKFFCGGEIKADMESVNKNIEVFDISNNKIKTLPVDIIYLTNIKRLSIGGNEDLYINEDQEKWIYYLLDKGCIVEWLVDIKYQCALKKLLLIYMWVFF